MYKNPIVYSRLGSELEKIRDIWKPVVYPSGLSKWFRLKDWRKIEYCLNCGFTEGLEKGWHLKTRGLSRWFRLKDWRKIEYCLNCGFTEGLEKGWHL